MDVALTSSFVTDIKHFNCFIFICPEVAFNFLGFLKKDFLSFEQSDHFFYVQKSCEKFITALIYLH